MVACGTGRENHDEPLDGMRYPIFRQTRMIISLSWVFDCDPLLHQMPILSRSSLKRLATEQGGKLLEISKNKSESCLDFNSMTGNPKL